MYDRSRGPERSHESDLRWYPPEGDARHEPPLALRDRLVSSALNVYLKPLSAVAFAANFVVIASVPVSAVAERVTHTVSAFHRIARCDRATAERVGK